MILLGNLCGAAIAAESPVTAVAFAPDGRSLLVGSQNGLRQLAIDLKPIRKLDTELINIHGIVFSPDRSAMAVCGGSPAQTGGMEVWTWPELTLRFRSLPHADVSYDVSWQPDGKRISSAGLDRTTRILDADSGRSLAIFRGHSRGITSVALLADNVMVTGSIDQSLRVWNASTGRELRALNNHTEMIHAIAARPKLDAAPPMLASISSDKSVRFWQPTIGRMVRFKRLTSIPRAIVWSPDGRSVIVACQDGTVSRIDHETVDVTWTAPGIRGWCYSAAIDAKGELIAVGGQNGQLKLVRLDQITSEPR
ncbi:MAG: hypothetical protein O3A00_01655 [Planctomycetota bacterium]|nr:hypothetical protein [Planctomycetota bacterium]